MKTRRNDIVLIAVLLIAGGALALFLWTTRQAGGSVSVTVGGELVMELPLDKDTRVELGGGERTNVLVIEDGAARVTEASCPDQICVHQGAVRYAGESIVCLPHGLVVTIEGGEQSGVDAIAGG